MAEPSTTKKAVDLEAFRAASELIATKAEVTKAIAEAQFAGGVEYATTEEVLALFQDSGSAGTSDGADAGTEA